MVSQIIRFVSAHGTVRTHEKAETHAAHDVTLRYST